MHIHYVSSDDLFIAIWTDCLWGNLMKSCWELPLEESKKKLIFYKSWAPFVWRCDRTFNCISHPEQLPLLRWGWRDGDNITQAIYPEYILTLNISWIQRPEITCLFSKPKNPPSTKWRGGRQCGYKSCFLLKSRRIIYIPFCRVHIEGEYIKYSVGAAQNIVIGILSKNLHIYGKWDL